MIRPESRVFDERGTPLERIDEDYQLQVSIQAEAEVKEVVGFVITLPCLWGIGSISPVMYPSYKEVKLSKLGPKECQLQDGPDSRPIPRPIVDGCTVGTCGNKLVPPTPYPSEVYCWKGVDQECQLQIPSSSRPTTK